ncbi:MAG: cobalamin B12-binding domain-containing protein [Chloroflexi bacterium]|nr:cobalamin B12-binding domain-containing protein [Chloroflexota bacterium]
MASLAGYTRLCQVHVVDGKGEDYFLESLARRLETALLSLDEPAVREVLVLPEASSSPLKFVDQVIVPVLEDIGKGWEDGKVALSQVYMSGRILETLVSTMLFQTHHRRESQPKMAIATLIDYHFLGKRLVSSALKTSGYELFDYGRVDVDEAVGLVSRDGIDVLLLSTLMLPSALRTHDVKLKLKAAGLRTKVVVGGAPFRLDPTLWKEVGADAAGRTASDAVEIVNRLAQK